MGGIRLGKNPRFKEWKCVLEERDISDKELEERGKKFPGHTKYSCEGIDTKCGMFNTLHYRHGSFEVRPPCLNGVIFKTVGLYQSPECVCAYVKNASVGFTPDTALSENFP